MNGTTSPYRSRCRIYYDILRAIESNGQAKVTYLLHKANLSYDRLVHHLDRMTKLDLIRQLEARDSHTYEITQKGRKYISEFRKIEDFGDAFGVEI